MLFQKVRYFLLLHFILHFENYTQPNEFARLRADMNLQKPTAPLLILYSDQSYIIVTL